MEKIAVSSLSVGGHDAGTVSLQAFQELLGNFTKLKARVEENFQKDHQAAMDMSAGWLILCGGSCTFQLRVACQYFLFFCKTSHHTVTCAGALAFFMQTGFAMLETGVVSKSNAINVLFKVGMHRIK
jgi:hypothetical protein